MRQFKAPIGNALEFCLIIDGERFKVASLANWWDGTDEVTIATLFGHAGQR